MMARVPSLLPPEIRATLPALYSQEKVKDKIIWTKFFYGSWTWFVTEAEEQDDHDVLFFGYVIGHEEEWGYFLLSELESVPLIERDLYFRPAPFSEVIG